MGDAGKRLNEAMDSWKQAMTASEYAALERALDKLKKVSPSSRKIFFKSIKHQMFPFLSSYINYICNNASASQLLKLYKTCKFFFIYTRGLIIIEDFEICFHKDKERIVGNSMAIRLENPAWSKLNNLWISKSFTLHKSLEPSLKLDHQKFSRLTYKSLLIAGKLSVTDYEFLIEPTTISQLFVFGEIYYSETGLHLLIEKVIKRAPHVSAFDLYDINFLTIDMDKLIALERHTKLQSLHFYDVSTIPDASDVVKFFKKHATPDIDYYFEFDESDDGYDEENVKTFHKTVNAGIRAWKISRQLPPTIPPSSIDLTGKLALITACDGIGRATAILFRELGASVVVFSRNSIQLKSLVEECQNIENDGFLQTVHGEEIASIDFEIFNYKFGSKIDILINYCDIFGFGGVPDMKSEEKFRTERFVIVDRCDITYCAKPYMIEAEGTMINVSNPHDLIVVPKEAEYVAKCEREIKNDEAELTSAGVRINTVNSGPPVTALPRPEGISDFDYKKLLKNSKKYHEQEIANAIVFLASSKLINGATLPISAKL